MSKNEFLEQLQRRLAGLSKEEITERIGFYNEMIDDRMEEGLSEEEAVEAVGQIDSIVSQIFEDSASAKSQQPNQEKNRPISAWLIVLLIVGSPIWLSLLITLFSVAFSLYISLWSIIISIWAVWTSLLVCSLALFLCGIIIAITRDPLTGTAIASASLVCTGASIFIFYGCKATTKGTITLTKHLFLWTKKCFVRKEHHNV